MERKERKLRADINKMHPTHAFSVITKPFSIPSGYPVPTTPTEHSPWPEPFPQWAAVGNTKTGNLDC